MSSAEQIELFREWRNSPTRENFAKLVESVEWLVKTIAWKMWDRRNRSCCQSILHFDDLVSEGRIAAINYIDRFDPGKGVALSTFLSMRIRGGIVDAMRNTDFLSRKARGEVKQGERKCPVFESINRTLIHFGKPISHDMILPGPQIEASRAMQIEDFWDVATLGLSENEEACVRLYFRESVTMKEIGYRLGLSESRVSQIVARTLKFIREERGERLRELAQV